MKGPKNKNHEFKRALSYRKFSRLFDANLESAGFAYVTKNWETKRSLRALKLGDIIYAEFASGPKGKNRLESYCVRYKVSEGWAEDFVAFSPFPLRLF